MRIFGVILIVIGLLVCLTIIGIPFGLFLMLVGLALIVFGSRRRTLITNVVQVSTTPGHQSLTIEESDGGHVVSPPRQPPIIDVSPPRQPAQIIPPRVDDYDRAKWDALVTYDDDIAQVEKRLKVLGQQWVDKFAKAYLAINDKSYLPMILNKIVGEARSQPRLPPAPPGRTSSFEPLSSDALGRGHHGGGSGIAGRGGCGARLVP